MVESGDAPAIEKGGSSVELQAELAEFWEAFDAAETDAQRYALRKRWYSRHPGVLLVRQTGQQPGDGRA